LRGQPGSSTFAVKRAEFFFSFSLRLLERPLPPRLMKKVSMDIAERYELDLRRRLRSADRFRETAILRGVIL
jgi:hypothetical protein